MLTNSSSPPSTPHHFLHCYRCCFLYDLVPVNHLTSSFVATSKGTFWLCWTLFQHQPSAEQRGLQPHPYSSTWQRIVHHAEWGYPCELTVDLCIRHWTANCCRSPRYILSPHSSFLHQLQASKCNCRWFKSSSLTEFLNSSYVPHGISKTE